MIPVAGAHPGPKWDGDGSTSSPTLRPSILRREPGKRCHSFVRGGVVEFLGDCDHDLAGKTVKMLPADADPFTDA
jgi:hypothetical protein